MRERNKKAREKERKSQRWEDEGKKERTKERKNGKLHQK
jgi:hypothetical protein